MGGPIPNWPSLILIQAFEAAVAGGVFEGPTRESLPVETIEQAETQSDSPRKRRRFEKGLPGGSEDQGAEGQEAELGWGARVESSAAEVKGGEQKEAQPGGGGREQSGAAELGGGGRENIGVEELGVRKQEQMELGGALQKKFNADNVEREGGRRDDSSQAAPGGMGAGVSKWPPFEKLFEMFLEHKNVSLIYEDLLQGYTDAKKKGKERAKEWNDIHLNLLLSRGQFVRANLSLVNGRHFEFAENRQAARPANSLVRVFLAQVLDDTAGNALVFAETEALGVLTAELSEGKHPVVVGALAERAVIAQLCLGAGKRFLRFPTSGAEATVVEAFETGDEQTLIDKLYKKAREELDRGAGEFLAICKPKSVAYRYIDAIQVYAQWEQGKPWILSLFVSCVVTPRGPTEGSLSW